LAHLLPASGRRPMVRLRRPGWERAPLGLSRRARLALRQERQPEQMPARVG
jgi:hypothetical protein